jgi:catechol 2,3-dioxygenase-like lactoylglutathione lyase family enzyme
MLKQIHTVLPAADLQRARGYYHDKLGLDPVMEQPGNLVYDSGGGTGFEVYETANAGTAKNTQMGWITDDLDGEMSVLRSHGVVFEEYDVPGMKTVDGVATMDDLRAAWFRDSEGNFLCITQRM